MGAWGEGPSQNDNALDLISDLKSEINDDEYKNDLDKFMKDVFAQMIVHGVLYNYESVLTVAEYFHYLGCDISQYRELIDQCIDHAIESAHEGWSHPKKRVEAMNVFRDILDGKDVDLELVKEFSEDLVSKYYKLEYDVEKS